MERRAAQTEAGSAKVRGGVLGSQSQKVEVTGDQAKQGAPCTGTKRRESPPSAASDRSCHETEGRPLGLPKQRSW